MDHRYGTTYRRPKKLDIQIDDLEFITHILSNLPGEYQNILEIQKKS